MSTPNTSGRRERKKAATRAAISTAALELFLERGFDAVSMRDVAERADVAVATIFAHFSGKESLVFDEDESLVDQLVATVRARPGDQDVLDALETWFLSGRAAEASRTGSADFAEFRALVDRTPALHGRWQSTWRGYVPRLAEVITDTTEADDRTASLVATLVVEGFLRAADDDHPDRALRTLYDILRNGAGPYLGSRVLRATD
ncbi:AcrR family transcriptional regulator [Curtobacterium pusillum]|uniref:AcrR family transcriptional regulator n=1 Tax=Curtobacterium pusillum TaxID=69373 RepID=A0AAW3T3I9_9MICO|nr:AcrR family transcriptional regulator [Curtobacterium pusillum]